MTNFYFASTLAHGILCDFSNSAIGYLLNKLACHWPWIDLIAPNTLVPLAKNELLPSWFFKPNANYNTSSSDKLRTGIFFW